MSTLASAGLALLIGYLIGRARARTKTKGGDDGGDE